MVTNRGDFKHFYLVSSRLYAFSIAESLFVQGLSKMCENHQANRTRSKFLAYPMSFLLTADLTLVMGSQLAGQTGMADPDFPALITKAVLASVNRDGSPVSYRARNRVHVDRCFIFDAFAKAAQGSKMDFLFLRQVFASHLAACSVMRFVFQAALSPVPNLAIWGESRKVSIPDFMKVPSGPAQLPLTGSLKPFLPSFMLKGTFACTWHAVSDVLWTHREKIRLLLMAVSDLPDENIEVVLDRSGRMAPVESEVGDKSDDPFSFLVLDQLLESAENRLLSQPFAYSWI